MTPEELADRIRTVFGPLDPDLVREELEGRALTYDLGGMAAYVDAETDEQAREAFALLARPTDDPDA